MGSSYFGNTSLGHGRSGSSRKGKKSNSDKPKQPQRGLGVAQLEKIRLSSEMGSSYLSYLHNPSNGNRNQDDPTVETAFSLSPPSLSSSSSSSPFYSSSPPSSSSSSSPFYSSSSFGFHPYMMMGAANMETTNTRNSELQHIGASRKGWNSTSRIKQPQEVQSSIMQEFLMPPMEKERREEWSDSMSTRNQNSDSSDAQELDLDLKLSL